MLPELASQGPRGYQHILPRRLGVPSSAPGLTIVSFGKLEPGTCWAEHSGRGFRAEVPKKVPATLQTDTTDCGLLFIPSVLKAKLHVLLFHSPSL